MHAKICRLGWISLLALPFAVSCTSKPSESSVTNEEPAVREKFAELQSALQKHDAEKLWDLLSEKSRADAERAAKTIQTAFNQAGAEEKAKQEETLGLSASELAKLDGKGFLKTKRFQKKYEEVPEGKIDKVDIQGDNATVHFLEPDGDTEKAVFVRQGGQWKSWLTMPRVNQP